MASSSSSSGSPYVSTKSATSGLTINLHPLPLLNIAEHANRARISPPSDPTDSKMVGALLGSQTNREIAILNTFQLVFDHPERASLDAGDDVDMDRQAMKFGDGRLMLDPAYLEERKKQFKEVFPTQDVIGWYSVGDQPESYDILLHSQLSETIDSPIFLLFNDDASSSGQDLPIKVYESALSDNSAETAMSSDQEAEMAIAIGGRFVQLEYGVETGEAERIAVDGVSRGGAGEDDEYSVIGNLTTQRNAIKMLSDRISVLGSYVDQVSTGQAKPDHAILRQISSLVATLPTIDAPSFQQELHTEFQDVQITSYLSNLTKQLDALADYSDKHHSAYARVRDDDFAMPGQPRSFGRGGGRKK